MKRAKQKIEPVLFNMTQAAQYLNIRQEGFYRRFIKSGKLKVTFLDDEQKLPLIPKWELERFIKERSGYVSGN